MWFTCTRILGSVVLAVAATGASASDAVSMSLPGASDDAGRKVLTFIAKDPPGVRCNGNLQVAAEVANAYKVPIRLLPSSLAPGLPAPAVFYGNQLLAADGKDFNGIVSFQMISDMLDVEGVDRQTKEGLLLNPNVRPNFDGLKDAIRSGGK